MEEDTDGSSVEDGTNHVLSVGSTSRDLQTAYLIISLVVSEEYLQKPSHYLRCNLAVDDIVFTGCLIPVRIYAHFRHARHKRGTDDRHYNGIRRFTSEATNKNVAITVKLFIHGIIS
ncbi:hypothetical protein Bbelb_000120 [Branchiostoma belcheri]|nr:hypothetical protein Bbelb_000120 [Branchiostoma belcheri]